MDEDGVMRKKKKKGAGGRDSDEESLYEYVSSHILLLNGEELCYIKILCHFAVSNPRWEIRMAK